MAVPQSIMNLVVLQPTVYPSTTYKLDLTTKRIGSKIEGAEAAVQAVQKIFLTERYANVIYSGNYGIELQDLVGQDFDYIEADIQRILEEAISSDNRLQAIEELTIEQTALNTVVVSCTIQTVDGAFTILQEVNI